MGALNIPLPAFPEAVRPEIPTSLILPATKTKGEMEARLLKSSSQATVLTIQDDVGAERLQKVTDGSYLDKEFDELLRALRVSLTNNFFT